MVSITIRDVPQETRNELAARAARSGRSLQEYLRLQLVEIADRPAPEEWVSRVQARVQREDVELSLDEILDARDADRR